MGTSDGREGHKAYLDHGEREGWGLRLPPSVAVDAAWRLYWAGVESVTVRVRRDSLVVEHAHAPAAPDAPRREVGRLGCFDEERGFGVVESPSGEDRFFHRSSLMCDPAELELGLPLEFEMIRGERGPVALRVRPLRLRSSG